MVSSIIRLTFHIGKSVFPIFKWERKFDENGSDKMRFWLSESHLREESQYLDFLRLWGCVCLCACVNTHSLMLPSKYGKTQTALCQKTGQSCSRHYFPLNLSVLTKLKYLLVFDICSVIQSVFIKLQHVQSGGETTAII